MRKWWENFIQIKYEIIELEYAIRKEYNKK